MTTNRVPWMLAGEKQEISFLMCVQWSNKISFNAISGFFLQKAGPHRILFSPQVENRNEKQGFRKGFSDKTTNQYIKKTLP